jgi:hypothetical protein
VALCVENGYSDVRTCRPVFGGAFHADAVLPVGVGDDLRAERLLTAHADSECLDARSSDRFPIAVCDAPGNLRGWGAA